MPERLSDERLRRIVATGEATKRTMAAELLLARRVVEAVGKMAVSDDPPPGYGDVFVALASYIAGEPVEFVDAEPREEQSDE